MGGEGLVSRSKGGRGGASEAMGVGVRVGGEREDWNNQKLLCINFFF